MRRPWSCIARACLLSHLVTLGPVCSSAATAADVPIAARSARLFIDEEQIVEDTVTAAHRDGSVVHLRLGSPPVALTVSLVMGVLSGFPDTPERFYLGKTVQVAGTIRSFRGGAEMVIRDPVHIRVLDTGASLQPGTADEVAEMSADNASMRQHLRALSQRVRWLEKRVQQLEDSRSLSDTQTEVR